MVYTKNEVGRLGSIIGIWAHPDDESWLSGGIIAAARANNQFVACVCATRGEAGQFDEQRWSRETLGQQRQKELDAALKILGVSHHYYLGFKDGQLKQASAIEAVTKIAKIFEKVKPDTVLTFGSDGITGHPDHITVHKWARQAVKQFNPAIKLLCAVEEKTKYETYGKRSHQLFNIYFKRPNGIPITYDTNEIDFNFVLTPALLKKKIAALKAQESQTYQMFKNKESLHLISKLASSEHFKISA